MYEHLRQYEQFKKDVATMKARFVDFRGMLRTMQQLGDEGGREVGLGGARGGAGGGGAVVGNIHGRFKTSKQKKKAILATMATNLQLHTTRFRVIYSSPRSTGDGTRSIAHGKTSGPGGAGEEGSLHLVAASATFGAPSAHSLGFKMGGSGRSRHASRTPCKMRPACSSRSSRSAGSGARGGFRSLGGFWSAAKTRRPRSNDGSGRFMTLESQAKLLRLKFLAHARMVIVVSQALQAVVAAAVQMLEQCFSDAASVIDDGFVAPIAGSSGGGGGGGGGGDGGDGGESNARQEQEVRAAEERLRRYVNCGMLVHSVSTDHGWKGGSNDRRFQRRGKFVGLFFVPLSCLCWHLSLKGSLDRLERQ